MNPDLEVWAFCPIDNRYMISTHGRVMGIRTDFLKPFESGEGKRYLSVKLGHTDEYRVHRLVAITFLPNPDNKPEVDHIDRNGFNNCISNLRWVTKSENQINKKIPCNNTTGMKNLYYIKNKDCWTIIIQRQGKRSQRYFKERSEAEEYLKSK